MSSVFKLSLDNLYSKQLRKQKKTYICSNWPICQGCPTTKISNDNFVRHLGSFTEIYMKSLRQSLLHSLLQHLPERSALPDLCSLALDIRSNGESSQLFCGQAWSGMLFSSKSETLTFPWRDERCELVLQQLNSFNSDILIKNAPGQLRLQRRGQREFSTPDQRKVWTGEL